MNRKFLILVAMIAGLTALFALIFFAYVSQTHESRGGDVRIAVSAINHPAGVASLVFAWFATACAMLLQLPGLDMVRASERHYRVAGLLSWKLFGLLQLALILAGKEQFYGSAGFGCWLGLIAGAVGALAFYLTFNDKLAGKLADKAKEMKAAAMTEGDTEPDSRDGTS
jgi:hypothetical protein